MPSRFFTNSRGQRFQSSTLGGTYPVNNGDPQCDGDEPEEENTDPGFDESAQDERMAAGEMF